MSRHNKSLQLTSVNTPFRCATLCIARQLSSSVIFLMRVL